MLHTIVTSLRKQQWGQAFFELLIVAVGILMAFQVDRWWEERRDRATEKQYLHRLMQDLQQDIGELERGIALAELRLSFARLLMDVAEDPELAVQNPVDFILAVHQASYTYTPALNSNTFDELRSTGNLRLLRNTELKDALFDYYRFDESMRQWLSLQLMQEVRHFEFGAGILSNRQLRRAHVDWGMVVAEGLENYRKDPVDLAAVRAAAARLQANDRFVSWLPMAHEMQLDLAETNRQRLRHVHMLRDILRGLQNAGQHSS